MAWLGSVMGRAARHLQMSAPMLSSLIDPVIFTGVLIIAGSSLRCWLGLKG